MNKKTGLVLTSIIVFFVVLMGIFIWQRKSQENTDVDYGQYKLSAIKQLSSQNDYSGLDLNSVLSAGDANGNLQENILGNVDAPVKIYEYADYPCGYCAQMNGLLNQIVEDYDGKVAIVFRTFVLDYHDISGVAAASAANAAALQGYWKEYKDLLFANQNEWFYSTGTKLQKQMEDYFEKATDGKGDLKKFQEDMQSEAVAKKVAFDRGIGEEMKIGGTPWLYLDGEWISNKQANDDTKGLTPLEYSERIRSLIDKKLK